MTAAVVLLRGPAEGRPAAIPGRAAPWGAAGAACALLLAGCAGQPVSTGPGPGTGRYFDPVLGVFASPRLVEDGQPVRRGGGGYLVGRPYTIGGRTFVPNANPQGYTVVGTASWYGDAFHGRRTANGEVFDKGSITAAHPTLPLPSYVRVTNLKNGRSMIVRVNDRGPYHGGRVMDVSQRVAEALNFKGEGTARIRVDYVGRAGLAGSDDDKLLASLRTDGPARLDGSGDQLASAGEDGPPTFHAGHIVERDTPGGRAPDPAVGASPPPPGEGGLPAAAAPVAIQPRRRGGARPELAGAPSAHGARPRRGAPARDPYFRPLFPPPAPAVSFAAPAPAPDGQREAADAVVR